jgi:hypothetical protein
MKETAAHIETCARCSLVKAPPFAQVIAVLKEFECSVDGDQCGDESLLNLAAIRRLLQFAGAGRGGGRRGWQALSGSKTREYSWGRECPNFGNGGFLVALAKLPASHSMGIGCELVEDEFAAISGAAAVYPQRCERGWVSPCRTVLQSGIAVLHVFPGHGKRSDGASDGDREAPAVLRRMTQIIDRSLEMLGRTESLEHLEFWQCMAFTDAGVANLAALPRLERSRTTVRRRYRGTSRSHSATPFACNISVEITVRHAKESREGSSTPRMRTAGLPSEMPVAFLPSSRAAFIYLSRGRALQVEIGSEGNKSFTEVSVGCAY